MKTRAKTGLLTVLGLGVGFGLASMLSGCSDSQKPSHEVYRPSLQPLKGMSSAAIDSLVYDGVTDAIIMGDNLRYHGNMQTNWSPAADSASKYLEFSNYLHQRAKASGKPDDSRHAIHAYTQVMRLPVNYFVQELVLGSSVSVWRYYKGNLQNYEIIFEEGGKKKDSGEGMCVSRRHFTVVVTDGKSGKKKAITFGYDPGSRWTTGEFIDYAAKKAGVK